MWELRFLGHAFGITDNDYYISENVVSWDLKATGAYIQAACEEQRRD